MTISSLEKKIDILQKKKNQLWRKSGYSDWYPGGSEIQHDIEVLRDIINVLEKVEGMKKLLKVTKL